MNPTNADSSPSIDCPVCASAERITPFSGLELISRDMTACAGCRSMVLSSVANALPKGPAKRVTARGVFARLATQSNSSTTTKGGS